MPGETARQNGKLGGRPPGRLNDKTIEAEAYRMALLNAAMARKDEIAIALVDKAVTGDVPAIKEINDRVAGKVVQGVDHTTLGKEMPAPILAGATQINQPADGVQENKGSGQDTGAS